MPTKLHCQYRQFIEHIFPHGTQRRELYRIFVRIARLLISGDVSGISKRIKAYRWPSLGLCLKSETKNLPESGYIIPISRRPLFVFQMGRVGSISVMQSIIKAYDALSIPIDVYHTHWQNDFEYLEANAKRDHADPSLLLRDLQAAKEIKRKLVDEATQRCDLISLVRDPVARNISTFFYALPEFLPDWEKILKSNSLTVEYLHKIFIAPRAFHSTPARWFDEQLKPVFDIDVYTSSFPKEIGYKIYSSNKARLLVLRLENLADCAKNAFYQFLGLQNFEIIKTNSGEDRNTGDLYRLFRSSSLSHEYVHQMYNTKYARHFYTETELNTFAHKWTSGMVS